MMHERQSQTSSFLWEMSFVAPSFRVAKTWSTKPLNTKLLKEGMKDWCRKGSPISYVDVNPNYNCRPDSCPDGHGGLHPNALGEYHIAQSFARVLQSDFGYMGIELRVPKTVVPRQVSTPANVQSTSYLEGL
jgi:hypothetical protein